MFILAHQYMYSYAFPSTDEWHLRECLHLNKLSIIHRCWLWDCQIQHIHKQFKTFQIMRLNDNDRYNQFCGVCHFSNFRRKWAFCLQNKQNNMNTNRSFTNKKTYVIRHFGMANGVFWLLFNFSNSKNNWIKCTHKIVQTMH